MFTLLENIGRFNDGVHFTMHGRSNKASSADILFIKNGAEEFVGNYEIRHERKISGLALILNDINSKKNIICPIDMLSDPVGRFFFTKRAYDIFLLYPAQISKTQSTGELWTHSMRFVANELFLSLVQKESFSLGQAQTERINTSKRLLEDICPVYLHTL